MVEKIGIERTFKKISEASIVLGMVDLTRDNDTTLETVTDVIESVDLRCQKLVILLNKTDIFDINKNVSTINTIVSLIDSKGFKAQLANEGEIHGTESHFEEKSSKDVVNILPISAKTGSGIRVLRNLLASTQRDLLGDSDTTLVTNQRLSLIHI